MRASVPANLLLLGEYAVLEEGGLGLAVAVDPRVRISAAPGRPGAGMEVAARMDTELR
jgi:mevalonate kinase